jgi:hypothetical protein
VTVGVPDGVAESGALLTGVVLLGAVAAGAVLAAGELLAPLGVVLLVGAVAAAPSRWSAAWVTGWPGVALLRTRGLRVRCSQILFLQLTSIFTLTRWRDTGNHPRRSTIR